MNRCYKNGYSQMKIFLIIIQEKEKNYQRMEITINC